MTFEEWWEGAAGKSISVSLNAALRSIAAAAWDAAEKAAQPKWQSIETCPSDGRPVLVYRPLAMRTHDPLVTIKLAIGGNNSCFPETVPPGSAPTNPTDGGCHATHWMPLPEPPND